MVVKILNRFLSLVRSHTKDIEWQKLKKILHWLDVEKFLLILGIAISISTPNISIDKDVL